MHRRAVASQACIDAPCCSELVRQTLQGCHRLLARPAQKKKPFTLQDIRKLIQCSSQSEPSLVHLQMMTLILLGFRGFLRWGDMVRLQPDSINISARHMSVFIESCTRMINSVKGT
eukprot:scpid81434/ scgid11043/ 